MRADFLVGAAELVGHLSLLTPDGEERAGRGLHEQSNPRHRLRVEHDNHTLLIHLSDEDGGGWTTIAVDRGSRRWTVAQDTRQTDTSRAAYDGLYKS